MKIDEDLPFRGEIRGAGVRRVTHGVGLKVRHDLDEWGEFLRDLRALLLVLPVDAAFTHVTAARLRRWRLPALPEKVPFFASTRGGRRPRRPGVVCSRLTHAACPELVEGLPVEPPEEILLRAARELGVLDLVIMIDSALHLNDLDPTKMEGLLASGRPGVRRLKKAWALADRRAESAGETILRLFHVVLDIPVETQVPIYDEERFIGRVDLLVAGTNFVHEYDGAVHRAKHQQRADLRRARGWAGTDYRRSGFTLDDLLNRAHVTMHELDRLLHRPHRAGRLARWRSLVQESLYSPVGRTRVMNRWMRDMGVVEWSGNTPRGG